MMHLCGGARQIVLDASRLKRNVKGLAFPFPLWHKPHLLNRPAERAAVAVSIAHSSIFGSRWLWLPSLVQNKESKMPKLKTKSGAKKRFKITGTGKVMYAQAGKRHGMIKRTKKQIRNLRGTTAMFATDAYNVKKFFLPNG